MNKEKLEERIKVLEADRASCIQTMSAYDGAIQDCKWWLSQLSLSSDCLEDKTDGKQTTKR